MFLVSFCIRCYEVSSRTSVFCYLCYFIILILYLPYINLLEDDSIITLGFAATLTCDCAHLHYSFCFTLFSTGLWQQRLENR